MNKKILETIENKIEDIQKEFEPKSAELDQYWRGYSYSGGYEPDEAMYSVMIDLRLKELVPLESALDNWRGIQKVALEETDELVLKKFYDIPGVVWQLATLRRLALTNSSITSLPLEIGQLQNLQYLVLNNNLLTGLSSKIRLLTNLVTLDLSKNKFKFLPVEVFDLVNLNHLDISFNLLKSLPSKIKVLKNLKYLNIKGNNIKSVPSEIGQLSNLEELII